MDMNHHNSKILHKTLSLYVEDDPVAYQVVSSFLKEICDIDWATNSDEALEKIDEKNYKLIFMDIHLPKGLSGIELTKVLRKNSKYSKVPIIAITAYAMAREKDDILRNGCNEYIAKPFTRKILLEIVNKYIG